MTRRTSSHGFPKFHEWLSNRPIKRNSRNLLGLKLKLDCEFLRACFRAKYYFLEIILKQVRNTFPGFMRANLLLLHLGNMPGWWTEFLQLLIPQWEDGRMHYKFSANRFLYWPPPCNTLRPELEYPFVRSTRNRLGLIHRKSALSSSSRRDFFYPRSWRKYWQFRNLHLPGTPLCPLDFSLSSLFGDVSPISLLIRGLKYNLPYVRYLEPTSEIDLVHSICRLYRCRKPWILVFDTPSLLVVYRDRGAHRIPQFSKTVVRRLIFSHNCKKVLAFSEAARKEFFKGFDIPMNMVEVLPPGVETPALSPLKRDNDKNVVILFVGIDFKRKGGFVLLEAFHKLCSKFDDVHLLVKTGPRFPPTILGGRYNQIRERITWINYQLPRNELNELYRSADIFVLPTLYEPFGLVLLEAMSFKLPVVASNIYAIPEIVEDGKTGFLIPMGNSEELFNKLCRLTESKALRERMGSEGRKRIELRFSNEIVGQRLKAIYEESLKK